MAQLTRDQLGANINAMEKQGAKPAEIQQYLDSLKTQGGPPQQSVDATGLKSTAVGGISDYPSIQNAGIPGNIANVGIGAVNVAKNIGVGIGSEIGQAGFGMAQVAAKGVSGIANVIGDKEGQQFYSDVSNSIGALKKDIFQNPVQKNLDTISGKVGQAIGTAAVFAEPGAKASTAEKSIDLLTQGMGTVTGAAARIVGKGVVQGAVAGVTDYLRTGGNMKEAEQTALTAGIARSVFATVGEVSRGLKIPERLYSLIFKNTKADMIDALKGDSIAALQKNDPQTFKSLVDDGIIKIKNGVPVVDKTVAQEALDRGLSGTLRNMAHDVVVGSFKNEQQAQNIVKGYQGTIDVSESSYFNVLTKISSDYQDVGVDNRISKEASDLATKVAAGDGQVDGSTALQVRRLLDRVRIGRSFDVQTTQLSLSQGNLKELADTLRGRLSENIPGLKDVMGEYSFNIDALESIAGEAKRRGNNAILGLIDSIFLGESLASGGIGPATLGIARRAATLPSVVTAGAQALNNPALSPAMSGLLQTTASAPGAFQQKNQ